MSARKANLTDQDMEATQTPFSSLASLPARWEWSRLGDVCKTTSGGTPSRKNTEYFTGDIPWVKSGELPDGIVQDVEERITEEAVANSSAKLFPAGTLLIALYGATVGKLGILKEDATTNQAVCAIFPPEHLDTKYLFWYLRFVRADLVAQAIGGAQPNISQGILRTLPIPVAPLDQQKQIVAEIEKQFSRLDEAVANLKRVKANLKRYKAAVLKAAVEGRLVETEAEIARREGRSYETGEQLLQRILETRRSQWCGRGKYKEPAAPDTTDLPKLPEGWVWASIEGVASHVVDCPHSTPKWTEHGKICVRTSDFEPGRLNLANVRYVSNETFATRNARLVPQAGDILYSREGGILGIACEIPPDIHLCLGQRMLLIRPAAPVSSAWIMNWLNSPFIIQNVRRLTGGSASPHLNVGDIRTFPVCVPPHVEQCRIIAEIDRRLSLLNEAEAQVDANLQRAARLRHSLLAQAFSGEQASHSSSTRRTSTLVKVEAQTRQERQ